jgi:hypothetical protein
MDIATRNKAAIGVMFRAFCFIWAISLFTTLISGILAFVKTSSFYSTVFFVSFGLFALPIAWLVLYGIIDWIIHGDLPNEKKDLQG